MPHHNQQALSWGFRLQIYSGLYNTWRCPPLIQVYFDAIFIFDFQLQRFISAEFWISLSFVISMQLITVSHMKLEWAADNDNWNIGVPMFNILVCISQTFARGLRPRSLVFYFTDTFLDSIMIIKWLMLRVILIILIPTITGNLQIHRIRKLQCFQIFKRVVNAIIFVLYWLRYWCTWEEERAFSRYEPRQLKQKGLDCVKVNLVLCLSKGSFCHLLYCQILNFRSPLLLVSLTADMKEASRNGGQTGRDS
jgi:hypothetical protein